MSTLLWVAVVYFNRGVRGSEGSWN